MIRESFMTVADEFGFTVENSPRFTAFATTEDRLHWHLNGEHRNMIFSLLPADIWRERFYDWIKTGDGKLFWLDLDKDFSDESKYAENGNIAHILKVVKELI